MENLLPGQLVKTNIITPRDNGERYYWELERRCRKVTCRYYEPFLGLLLKIYNHTHIPVYNHHFMRQVKS